MYGQRRTLLAAMVFHGDTEVVQLSNIKNLCFQKQTIRWVSRIFTKNRLQKSFLQDFKFEDMSLQSIPPTNYTITQMTLDQSMIQDLQLMNIHHHTQVLHFFFGQYCTVHPILGETARFLACYLR
ncbi:uncharacterized protein LOC123673388 [Harmonia axyridis]|uniref:uncharacterized protein LOC123673388 n=1 Tax=Harmonia axyridis TaxID=115357 RepID=UPI001E279A17|nr:uncharacterized protein LOC123673388 [Harmonia axyridis]